MLYYLLGHLHVIAFTMLSGNPMDVINKTTMSKAFVHNRKTRQVSMVNRQNEMKRPAYRPHQHLARRARVACSSLIAGLWFLFVSCALAQTLNIASDPAALAKAALGNEPGSASVAVWRAGRIEVANVHNAASLPTAPANAGVTEDLAPLYEIGSISKVFTGLLLAQAVEQGDLQLTDTLGTLLRGTVVFSSPEVAAITLQQLVTHGSCLPRQFGNVRGNDAIVAQITKATRAEMWAALGAQKLGRAGPCPALYSNYGMSVLAEVLSLRYGKPWPDLVRERITAPAAMSDTQVQLGDKAGRFVAAYAGRSSAAAWDMDAFVGAGGLRSSVQDLARFGRALLQGRNGPLGAPAERFFTPLADFHGGQIGYAVFIDGPPDKRSYSHDGLTGGYRALLTMHADTGDVMAAMASNRFAPLPQMGVDVSQSRYPVEREAVPLDAARLPDYTGSFRVSQERIFHVVADGGSLYVRSQGGLFRAYIPVGPDRFTRPAGGARISFTRSPEGPVNALMLEQGGRVFRGTRIAAAEAAQQILPAGAATAYLGRYVAPRFLRSAVEFNVRETAGQLMIRSTTVDWQPIFPVAGQTDRFRYDVPAELQFERDASGSVTGLVLHENGELRAARQPLLP